PVAIGDTDRAEEAEIVEMEDDAGAGRAPGRERPPAEEGMEIVGVDHVGSQRTSGARDRIPLEAAVPQRRGRPAAPQLPARALEDLHRVTPLLEQTGDLLHRPLFTALGAIP